MNTKQHPLQYAVCHTVWQHEGALHARIPNLKGTRAMELFKLL